MIRGFAPPMILTLVFTAGPMVTSRTSPDEQLPRVDYRVTCRTDSPTPQWEIDIAIAGLDPDARDYAMRLDNWGEWVNSDSYYLTGLASEPPVRWDFREPESFDFDFPREWHGSIHLHYRLHLTQLGSNAQQANSLLPVRAPGYSFGFSQNTLMRLVRDDKPVAAERSIGLVPPDGWKVATGWVGISDGIQTAVVRRDDDNGLIAFGLPTSSETLTHNGVRHEAVQFGQAAVVTNDVLRIAGRLTDVYGRHTSKPMDRPVRIFIVDTNSGGTRTDHGLQLGFTADTPASHVESPYFIQFVAHELFHDWLGGYLTTDDESLVWFYEGFTDYLALWHVAMTELVPREWFVERILELDQAARESTAYGKESFADPDVNWRDGDGPKETLAYKGGALLAFCTDVELRRHQHPGLLEMIADLAQENGGVYSQASIRTWMERHGLADFYQRHIESGQPPVVGECLQSVGYTLQDVPVDLTYLGIRADGEGLSARIVEVDPDGPSAGAFQVGDVVSGFFPTRDPKPRIGAEVQTRYRFGLDLIDPDVEGAFVSVWRNDTKVRIPIDPRLVSGGYETIHIGDESKLRTFFAFRRTSGRIRRGPE